MARPVKIEGFQCPNCDRIYDKKEDATNCCEVQKVEAWKCLVCDEVYMFKEDALQCCVKDE